MAAVAGFSSTFSFSTRSRPAVILDLAPR